MAPSWEEDEPPTPPPSVPASPLVPHRLAEGNRESSLSTHPLHYKRPVLILTRCLRPLPPPPPTPPSHLHICSCERSLLKGELLRQRAHHVKGIRKANAIVLVPASLFVCLTYLTVDAGSSQRLLQPGEDCEPEEGATALPGHHHRRGEGLSQPSAGVHHQRAASRLSAPRGNH